MRMPATRRLLALSAAAGVLVAAGPALAQPDGPYEYARPAPQGEVVFRSDPMVQDLPALPPLPVDSDAAEIPVPPLPPVPVPPVPAAPAAVPPPIIAAAPVAPPTPYAPTAYAPSAYHAPSVAYPVAPDYAPQPYPLPGYAHAAPVGFDRDRWLDDCRDRIRGVSRQERGGVIGGLLGAITGGVIGNRAWGAERLAGTLLGGGVGALAGLAVGSAIGAAGDRRADDECAWYLDRHMSQAYPGGYPGYAGYAHPGYGYGPAGYALVPVLVAVPQRRVVREIVTEEWIDEPVRTRSIPPRRHHAAPAGDKRVKLIKGN
ncbi:hypothetical protein [Parafrankia sp. BMG5.11]|uniref:hypothetical protein n=1 Tax=Parafrankia sp. BMG5.11 TaxID=222540 RepID=UPI001038697E|nr:hypothetical protein [Parafrankia sp. BMG5.11]TCJ41083.1 hypothetical protein E0504_00200 [Parafrankia sp. BMG5.11]